MPIYPIPTPTPTTNYFYPAGSGGGGGGTITGATNLGTGAGVFAQVNGVNLEFKSLTFTGGVSLVESATEIQISAAGAMFDRTANYVPLGLGAITGDWLHLGGFNVQAGSGNVVLQSDTGSVSVVAPTPGQLVAVQGDEVQISSGLQNLQLTSTGADVVIGATVGDVNLLSSSDISIDCASVLLPSIPNSVTANTLYYDSALKKVSWGAVPGPGSDWTLSGSNSGINLKFGTNSADGWEYQANSVVFATVNALGHTTYTGDLYVNGLFEVQSPEHVIINAAGVGKTMSILSDGDAAVSSVTANVQIDAGVTMLQNALTSWEVTSPIYKLVTLPAGSQPDVVFFNSVDGSLSYASASSLLANAWKIDGSNNTVGLKLGTSSAVGWDYQTNSITFASVSSSGNTSYTGGLYANGAFEVHSPEHVFVQTNNGTAKNVTVEADATLFLKSTTGSITSTAAGNTTFNPVGTFNATCADFVASASNNASVLCANQLLVRSSAGDVTTQATVGSVLEVAGTSWEATAPVYKLNTLPSGSSANLVYFDSTSKELSFAAPPSLPSNLWLTDGSNSGVLLFGTNSADGWSYQANSVVFATVSALGETTYTGKLQVNAEFGVNSSSAPMILNTFGAGNYVQIYSNNDYMDLFAGGSMFITSNASTNMVSALITDITAGTNLNLKSNGAAISIWSATNSILNTAAVSWEADAPVYKLTSLPSGSTANLVYFDITSKEISYGPAPSVPSNLWKTDGSNSGVGLVLGTNSANGWSYQANSVSFASVSALGATTYTGSFQANGSFGVNSPTTMNINTSSGSSASVDFIADQNMYIEATNGSGEFYAANGLNLTCDTTITAAALQNIYLHANQVARLRSNGSNVEVTATAGSVLTSAATDFQVTASAYKLMTLPSASTTSAVFYNTTSKALSYGSIPAQTYPVVDVSSDITMSVNTIYHVTLFSPNLTLPAVSAKGDTIKIRLLPNGTMFSILQGAGQIVYLGLDESTLGATGYTQTVDPRCSIDIECIVANTEWQVVASVGNFDLV